MGKRVYSYINDQGFTILSEMLSRIGLPQANLKRGRVGSGGWAGRVDTLVACPGAPLVVLDSSETIGLGWMQTRVWVERLSPRPFGAGPAGRFLLQEASLPAGQPISAIKTLRFALPEVRPGSIEGLYRIFMSAKDSNYSHDTSSRVVYIKDLPASLTGTASILLPEQGNAAAPDSLATCRQSILLASSLAGPVSRPRWVVSTTQTDTLNVPTLRVKPLANPQANYITYSLIANSATGCLVQDRISIKAGDSVQFALNFIDANIIPFVPALEPFPTDRPLIVRLGALEKPSIQPPAPFGPIVAERYVPWAWLPPAGSLGQSGQSGNPTTELLLPRGLTEAQVRAIGTEKTSTTGAVGYLVLFSAAGKILQIGYADSCGASAKGSLLFAIAPPDAPDFIPNIVLPSSTSPTNQRFLPTPLGGQLTIYNRWGQQVFRTATYQGTWPSPSTSPNPSLTDTDKVATGTYFFRYTTPKGKQYRGWLEVAK